MIRLTRLLLPVALLVATPSHAVAAPGDVEPTGPSAADVATARELFRTAVRFAQQERWQDALDAYQRSMALRPSNLTRYSMAIAQERTGLLVEAMETLRTFLAKDQDGSTIEYVATARSLMRSIEQRIARIKVTIPGRPRGAQVLIDGVLIPEAAIGVDRMSNPGRHRVEARVAGYPPFVKNVEVAEAQSIVVPVRLGERGDDEPADAPVDKPGDAGASGGSNTAAIALTAGGAIVFAGGLTFGILGYAKAKGADTSSGGEADSARTMALVGDIAMGAGLVATGIGTYLLLSSDDASKPASSTTVSPWTTGSAGGVLFQGRF